MPQGKRGEEGYECSPFADAQGPLPGVLPAESVEMVWRELLGGALLDKACSMASRHGFEDSLMLDWRPLAPVEQALAGRQRGRRPQGRCRAVMLPSQAMAKMLDRSRRHVAVMWGARCGATI